MNKLFDRIFWHNNTTPALNESNLNAMSKGIDDIDNRVVDLAGDIMETIPQLEEDLETAQELIDDLEDLNEHTPYIGANGNWWVWNTTTKEYEDSGVDASISVQIADITMLAPSATPYVTNSGTATDPIFHLFIPRGHGVSSVAKTSTSGLVDTYTMTFTDGSTFTYTVTNGADGVDGVDGKTAYESAVDGGYTGTESEFNTELANLPSYATNAAQSASNASASANAASGSASSAGTSAENSEAWAVGQRGGVDVPPTDPTYHNNAKYWSEQSAGQSLEGLTDVNISSPTNDQALKYDSVSGKWVNGDAASAMSNLTDVDLANPSAGQALVYSSVGKWTNVTLPSASGDMLKSVYDPNDDGKIDIAQGGTGNSAGYIRTGKASGTNTGIGSTTEGTGNTNTGGYSHVEGQSNSNTGNTNHIEGINNTASGYYNHVEGQYCNASHAWQHVMGVHNDNKQDTLFEVGYGPSGNNKKNVFEIYQDGYMSFDNGVNKIKFGVDANGRYGYIKAGADTVYPFKNEITVDTITPTRTWSNAVLSFTYTDRPSYFAIIGTNSIYACWAFVSFEWAEIADTWTNKKAVWHVRTTSSSTKGLRDDYGSYLSISEDTDNKTITVSSSNTSYKFNATDYIVQAVAST